MIARMLGGELNSTLRGTGIVVGGTLLSLLLGIAANKVYAVVLGPAGVGLIGLLLSAVAVAALMANLGLATSVTALIGAAAVGQDRRSAADVQHVARRLGLASAVGVAVILTLWSDPISNMLFGAAGNAIYVVAIGVAGGLTALAHIEIGVMNGHRRLRAVSIATMIAAATGAVLGIAAVTTAGVGAFALATAATALAYFVVSRFLSRTIDRDLRLAGDAVRRKGVAVRLLTLAAPAAVSQLFIVAAHLLIPVLILQTLGAAQVGLYRAAALISISYMTLVFSTLSHEFLPRLAGVSAGQLARTIDQHMRLLFSTALPVILGLLAFSPVVISLLFTEGFLGAAAVLQWLLIGDLLRIPSWTLAFSLMARGRSKLYFALESFVGIATLFGASAGLALGGIVGTAIGYAVAQAAYLGVAWIAALRSGMTAPGRLQTAIIGIAVGAAVLLAVPVPEWLRSSVLLATAIAVAVAGTFRLIRDARAPIL